MGPSSRVDKLTIHDKLKAICPSLTKDNYQETSRATSVYNCVGWVLGDETRWYEPTDSGQYFWLGNKSADYSLKSYTDMFTSQGFEVCEKSTPEDGFQKIALYVKEKEFSHVALQVPSGRWSSKLGAWEDIEHDTLEAISGPLYGEPRMFMSRKRTESPLL